MSDRFTEGQDVLARWSDGLFYLGTITKVSVRGDMIFLFLYLHLLQCTRYPNCGTIFKISGMCKQLTGISVGCIIKKTLKLGGCDIKLLI